MSFPQLQLTPDNFTVATVTHTGAKLSLPGWGVSLLIPPGALDTGFVEEVFLAVVPLPSPPLADHQVIKIITLFGSLTIIIIIITRII